MSEERDFRASVEAIQREYDHFRYRRQDEEHEWVCAECRRFTFGKARWPCQSQRFADRLHLALDWPAQISQDHDEKREPTLW